MGYRLKSGLLQGVARALSMNHKHSSDRGCNLLLQFFIEGREYSRG